MPKVPWGPIPDDLHIQAIHARNSLSLRLTIFPFYTVTGPTRTVVAPSFRSKWTNLLLQIRSSGRSDGGIGPRLAYRSGEVAKPVGPRWE